MFNLMTLAGQVEPAVEKFLGLSLAGWAYLTPIILALAAGLVTQWLRMKQVNDALVEANKNAKLSHSVPDVKVAPIVDIIPFVNTGGKK